MRIRVSPDLAAKLRTAGRSEGRPIAALVREALADWLAERGPAEAESKETKLGGYHSGLGNLAEEHDLYLAPGDLVSVAEVSRRTGRPVSTVQSWRRRYESFPRPMATLAAGPVWDWWQIERWTRRHAAGATRRRRSKWVEFPVDLPGADLVSAGLVDLAAGKQSIEAALVSLAVTRLRSLGIDVAAEPPPDADDQLYRLVEQQVGEAGAHSRYNALRRRLVSFMRALAVANAPAG